MQTPLNRKRDVFPFHGVHQFKQHLLGLPRHLTVTNITNGVMAWLFGVTGPLLIVFQAAERGGLDLAALSSWIFSIYFVGGCLSILLSLYYGQPIAVAFSIPGAVLVGTTLMHHPFSQVIGAYVVTGCLILALGLSGIVDRLMKVLPMPVMMGMVAGVLLPFGTDIVGALTDFPLLNGAVFCVFLVLSLFTRLSRIFPPILGALIFAALLLAGLGLVRFEEITFGLAEPRLFKPQFDLAVIGELVIPLMLTVIAIQNAQGIGVMRGAGFEPPISAMTNWSGVGSLLNSLFGAHSACIAGPMTAILTSDVDPKRPSTREGTYAGAVVMGLLWVAFGVFAPFAALLTQMVPASLIKLLGGLAMVGVLVNTLKMSFSGLFKMGALFSFLITVSGFSLFNVGAPFWGLVGGTLISLLLERNDFKQLGQERKNG